MAIDYDVLQEQEELPRRSAVFFSMSLDDSYNGNRQKAHSLVQKVRGVCNKHGAETQKSSNGSCKHTKVYGLISEGHSFCNAEVQTYLTYNDGVMRTHVLFDDRYEFEVEGLIKDLIEFYGIEGMGVVRNFEMPDTYFEE